MIRRLNADVGVGVGVGAAPVGPGAPRGVGRGLCHVPGHAACLRTRTRVSHVSEATWGPRVGALPRAGGQKSTVGVAAAGVAGGGGGGQGGKDRQVQMGEVEACGTTGVSCSASRLEGGGVGLELEAAQAVGLMGATGAQAGAQAVEPAPAVGRRALLQGVSLLYGTGAAGVLGGVTGAGTATAAAPVAPSPPPPPLAPAPASAAAGSGGGVCGAPQGWAALRDPSINRGLATPTAVRASYRLGGLLPPAVVSPDVEVARAAAAVARAEGQPLLQYQLLMGLRDSDEATFYTLVQQDLPRYLPLVYTPTVGDACLAWGSLLPPLRPACLHVGAGDAGRVGELVGNWRQEQASIAVLTDGERILGLGDLGAHGAGIPAGKAAVYGAALYGSRWWAAAAGGLYGGSREAAAPEVVPVVLDVGTDNEQLLSDPLYCGLRQRRLRSAAPESRRPGGSPGRVVDGRYYQLVDETVEALRSRYGPSLVVHWEDVGAEHAFPLLQRLSSRGVPTFNDDIQATAAVTLAALLGAERLAGVEPLDGGRGGPFLFFGAGQANLGVAQLLVSELVARGLSSGQAAERVWLMDSRGLVTLDRPDIAAAAAAAAADPSASPSKAAAKVQFAQPRPPAALRGLSGETSSRSGETSLAAAVRALRPRALVGAAAAGGAFTPEVLKELAQAQAPGTRPIVLALSNPTSKAECSFAEAWTHTGGSAVFASGTQFPPLSLPDGRTLRPAQANNCYVFPGLGAGVAARAARTAQAALAAHYTGGLAAAAAVTVGDAQLRAAAQAIAGLVSPSDLAAECVLPDLGRLGECADAVAEAVEASWGQQ